MPWGCGEMVNSTLGPADRIKAPLVNGSQLVRGINAIPPTGIAVTGGLAGDGARFGKTRSLLHGMPHAGTSSDRSARSLAGTGTCCTSWMAAKHAIRARPEPLRASAYQRERIVYSRGPE
jgi:hypothetical protein